METKISWPDGKRFAFTVFDDTDRTTLQNGPQIYQFLHDLGVLTTKSVWPLRGEKTPRIGGATCRDPDYLRWICQLKEQGFEIGFHGATYHTSNREQTIEGIEEFKRCFGAYPGAMANHADCEEGIYWGDARLGGMNRLLYNLLTRNRNRGRFQGHVESSELFWGDICSEKIGYVRNFVYADINTLKVCPYMPYHDERRPYVKYWFASSEGHDCSSFCETISEKNVSRLEEEGGACIMYTHFGVPDFLDNGNVNSRFKKLMTGLSRRSGWFVPVSTLLDHIQRERGRHTVSSWERIQLESKWLFDKTSKTRGTS